MLDFDSIQYKPYVNPKSEFNEPNYKKAGLFPAEENSIKTKIVEDEEFYRLMELIKTEKNDQLEYKKGKEIAEDSGAQEDVSVFMMVNIVFIFLTIKIVQSFQSMVLMIKDLFDQAFPYIWSWMKSITRETYAVKNGKVGVFLLCVPLLTIFLILYCSLLTFSVVTELLLNSAPCCVTQMIVTEKFNKLLIQHKPIL